MNLVEASEDPPNDVPKISPSAAAIGTHDDDKRELTQKSDPPPSESTVIPLTTKETLDEAKETTVGEPSEHEPEDDDDELDVVVTAVEIENTTLISSLPVPYGSYGNVHGVVVELVVSSGNFSYRRQRQLSALLNVLQRAVKSDDDPTNKPATTTIPTTPESNPETLGDGTSSEEAKPTSSSIGSASVRPIPEFPSRSTRNDTLVAKWCGEMTAFLALAKKQLNSNVEWLRLMQDDELSSERNSTMTAIDFVLQPFPYEKCYVARGSMHQVTIQILQPDQFVLWKFELEDHDIEFRVTFQTEQRHDEQQDLDTDTDQSQEEEEEEQVHAPTRYLATSAGSPVEGSYQCQSPGKVCFTWDNSYSRIRGKNILYQVQVVDPKIMESASAAADAFDEAVRSRHTKQKDIVGKVPSDANNSCGNATPLLAPGPGSSLLPMSLLQLNRSELVSQAYQHIHIPETIAQSWIVSAPMEAAGRIVSGIFGAREEPKEATENADAGDGAGDGPPPQKEEEKATAEADDDDEVQEEELTLAQREAKSLLEELNGLNMQLLTRNEALEDFIASLTVERDQARSQAHLIQLDKDKLRAERDALTSEKEHLEAAVQRLQRDRDAWVAVQAERDALLEEKHRWAAADDFEDEEEPMRKSGSLMDHLDPATRKRLEEELDKAEVNVVRLRVELGYSLTNHAATASSAARLERITKEMIDAREAFEAKVKQSEEALLQLKQQNVKFRYQKRVLATELRNLKTEMEGQIAVAIAEASEARMVNRRLKMQNELLLNQMRTLVDSQKPLSADANNTTTRHGLENSNSPGAPATSTVEVPPTTSTLSASAAASRGSTSAPEPQKSVEVSPVPYTLTAEQVALLNGQPLGVAARGGPSRVDPQDHRSRLVAFFQEKDPSMLTQVDEMLASYRGVESSLFESLELKYSFQQFQAQVEE